MWKATSSENILPILRRLLLFFVKTAAAATTATKDGSSHAQQLRTHDASTYVISVPISPDNNKKIMNDKHEQTSTEQSPAYSAFNNLSLQQSLFLITADVSQGSKDSGDAPV